MYKQETIELSDGSVATVDSDVLPKVSEYSWNAARGGGRKKTYAVAYIKGSAANGSPRKYINLSELVIGKPPDGQIIDHIDGNSLNNTRANLRFVTPRQNAMNAAKKRGKSAYKGVTTNSSGKWYAAVSTDRFQVRSQTYETELEAAAAYNQIAAVMFGKYARLNNVQVPNGFDAVAEIVAAQRKIMERAERVLALLGRSGRA